MRARRGPFVGMEHAVLGPTFGASAPPRAGRGGAHSTVVMYLYVLYICNLPGGFWLNLFGSVHATALLTQVVACYMLIRFSMLLSICACPKRHSYFCVFKSLVCYFGSSFPAPSLTRPPTPEGRGERCVAVRSEPEPGSRIAHAEGGARRWGVGRARRSEPEPGSRLALGPGTRLYSALTLLATKRTEQVA